MKQFTLSNLALIARPSTVSSGDAQPDELVNFNYSSFRPDIGESLHIGAQRTSSRVSSSSSEMSKSGRHLIPVVIGLITHLWRH